MAQNKPAGAGGQPNFSFDIVKQHGQNGPTQPNPETPMASPTVIAFRVNQELRIRLENAARAQKRTLSNYLRFIIEDYEEQKRTLEQDQKNQVH